jgi:hypothetical protein
VISIRRYLNTEQRNQAAGPEPDSHSPAELCALLAGVLECISQFVLTGEANEAPRSRLLEVKEALRPDLKPEEAARAAESVSSILAAHHAFSQRAGVAQLVEAQHIFGMLNQALVVLADGNDQGFSRLFKIQESLQRTAKMRDMPSLKASLAETVQFIETESANARETAARELGRFETEVASGRAFLGATPLELAGRPEGVTEIAESLKSLIPGEALYLLAYLCDRLSAVTQRYGPGVTDELISHLIRERLKPVMPENTMYRWTPSSLVAVFSRPRDAEKLRSEVAKLNRTPLVHKMTLGGRTAVLTLSPSHLVAEGLSGPPAALIEQVDRFTRSGA